MPAAFGRIRGRIFLGGPPNPAPRASAGAFLELTGSYAQVAVAGFDGGYEISGLAPGRYQVVAWNGTWAMEALDRDRELVDVRAGECTDGVDRTLIPGGLVTGKVVNEASKEPISGAKVECGLIRFAVTGDDGSFRIDGVAPGVPWVSASARGFTSRGVEVEVAADGASFVVLELSPAGVIEGLITTPTGEPAAGARVWTIVDNDWCETKSDAQGLYALEGVPLGAREIMVLGAFDGRYLCREGVQGFPEGKTTIHLDLQLEAGFRLAGLVVDAARRPIASANLYLEESGWKPVATTDGEGRFSLDGGSRGMWVLTARKAGFSAGTQDLSQLESNEEREAIEIVLQPGHFVEGRVIDSAGKPVHRAWVSIDLVGNDAGPYPSTYTDKEGRFRLEDLPESMGWLAAAKPGYCESRENHVEADQADVELVLEQALIEGIVVEKASGSLIPEFTVRLEGTERQAQSGRFQIASELVCGRKYRVTVIADGYSEAVAEGIQPWLAAAGREPLRIELDRGGEIEGRVVSTSTHAPVDGVGVTHLTELSDSRQPQWFDTFWARGRIVRNAVSGAAGRFSITGVSNRQGALLLDKKGFARTVITGVRPGGSVQTFELAPGAAVEGTATSVAGRPAAGVSVRAVVGGQRFPETLTGADGRFRMDDLPPGDASLQFEVSAPAGQAIPRHLSVELRPGQTSVADFVIATGSIAGTLTRNGVPLEEAHVVVTGGSGEGVSCPTDRKGRFLAVCLPPGPYEVRVDSVRLANDFNYRSVGLVRKVVVGGGETQCAIDLGATAISGRVIHGGTGEPALGAHVALLNTDGWTYSEAACPPSGNRFDLEAPGTGTYYLAASAANGESATGWLGPLEIEEGIGLRDVELPMGGAASVSVSVLDSETKQPLEGARATLIAAGGFAFRTSAAADASGQARLTDLPAGGYSLEVETEAHLPHFLELKLGSTGLEKTIELERTSRIVVEVEGGRGPQDGFCVEATVIEGGDPGWHAKGSESGGWKAFQCWNTRSQTPPKAVFKTRAGRYRLRILVAAPPSKPLSDADNIVEEVDLIVPERGEANVRVQGSKR